MLTFPDDANALTHAIRELGFLIDKTTTPGELAQLQRIQGVLAVMYDELYRQHVKAVNNAGPPNNDV